MDKWISVIEPVIFVLFGVFAVKVLDFFTAKNRQKSEDERHYIEQFQEEFAALRERIAVLEKKTEEQHQKIVELERENAQLREQNKFLEQTIRSLTQ